MAEDNRLSSILAQSMLKKIGWSLDVVENGLLVLEKLKSTEYDLVLMDVEMPVMNGFETAAHIRKELPPPLNTIPIIACTALTNSEELEKCKAAGMNDCIAKPFMQNELVMKVNALLAPGSATGFDPASAMISEGKPVTEKGTSVINLQNLMTLSGSNAATVNNILTLFLKQSPERLENLTRLIGLKDWANVKEQSHKMKSSYSIIGAISAKSILATIEEDCVQNNIDENKFKSLMDQLTQLNHEIVNSIKMRPVN